MLEMCLRPPPRNDLGRRLLDLGGAKTQYVPLGCAPGLKYEKKYLKTFLVELINFVIQLSYFGD